MGISDSDMPLSKETRVVLLVISVLTVYELLEFVQSSSFALNVVSGSRPIPCMALASSCIAPESPSWPFRPASGSGFEGYLAALSESLVDKKQNLRQNRRKGLMSGFIVAMDIAMVPIAFSVAEMIATRSV